MKNTKLILKDLSNKDLKDVEFLQNFDLLAIDCDLTDNMENLTKKRMMFCQDPNDLVQLSLEREGEEGRRSIKLYNEEDIETIKEYLKDESCSCILVEDAYFENTEIMNLLLDDNLEELCLLAQQSDKFIFIITKMRMIMIMNCATRLIQLFPPPPPIQLRSAAKVSKVFSLR